MATPLIVHWPAGIAPSRRGTWIESFGYLPDFMPTCLELSGGEYPSRFGGLPVTSHSGKSLVPLLTKGDSPIHQGSVFWEHEGNRALREGDWKLVWSSDGPWELYNLALDRTEMNNLATQRPGLVAEMQQRWEGWARRTGVQFQTSFNYYQMIRRHVKSQKASQ